MCVKVGDRVLRGQPLTRGWGRMLPVHAPTSGTIAAIAPHTTAHPSALAEMSVIIDADAKLVDTLDQRFTRAGLIVAPAIALDPAVFAVGVNDHAHLRQRRRVRGSYRAPVGAGGDERDH